METDRFYTVTKGGDSLVEVKRSKFIGVVRQVSSEEDAESLLAGERKKYHDAKHHCSAYIIRGKDGAPDTVHSSDDGEPSGTAGAPMLGVLNGAGLKDAAVVVTRYFGGTLLGTGGLARAYTDAAKAALDDAVISEMALMQQFCIKFDYSYTGSIDHFIGQQGVSKLDSIYTDKVEYKLAVKASEYEMIKVRLTDITKASMTIEDFTLDYVAVTSIDS